MILVFTTILSSQLVRINYHEGDSYLPRKVLSAVMAGSRHFTPSFLLDRDKQNLQLFPFG